MSAPEVNDMARQWGMADGSGWLSPENCEKAAGWYNRCAYHSAYSVQIFNVFAYQGVAGILCMASTAKSCSVDNANSQPGVSQLVVTQNPGWWYFSVYWYPRMAMGNWWRLDEYDCGHALGTAQEFRTLRAIRPPETMSWIFVCRY